LNENNIQWIVSVKTKMQIGLVITRIIKTANLYIIHPIDQSRDEISIFGTCSGNSDYQNRSRLQKFLFHNPKQQKTDILIFMPGDVRFRVITKKYMGVWSEP